MIDEPDEPRRASWRDYTIHPDGHHDWKVEPNGAYVLCRSDGACEEAVYNPEREYLDLGTAVDWARTHHAEHLRNLIADDPEGYRDTMREAFKRGGPEALYDMENPQGSKLILDDPERGQPVTVAFDDGRVVKAWFLGYGIGRCKDRGMGAADQLDLTLIVPDDPRRAEMHFRDTFEPVPEAERTPVDLCGARWPGHHDGLEAARPVCVGLDGHDGWHAAPYLGLDPLGTEYRWNPALWTKDGAPIPAVPGPITIPVPKFVDTACICTIDNRTGLIYDREAECFQHGAKAVGCTCTHVPALEPTGPTPNLADCSRHAPVGCQCPDELEFHLDCPVHQPAPGQCRWCSGWDGTHALRGCRGAA